MEVDESYLIKPETPIMDIVDAYPEVVEFLVNEYDYYCMNCMMSEWETFEEGASNHGIKGIDFAQMLKEVNEIVMNMNGF